MTAACVDQLPNVTSADIQTVFAPFVVERFAPDDLRWLSAVARVEEKYAKPPKNARRWTTDDGQRTTELVQRGYESAWNRLSLETLLTHSKQTHFEWRGEGMLAHAVGRKRVHQLLLVRVLEWLRPDSVVEVGFGFGFNLLLLSMQRPDILFSGIELTEAGVASARSLAQDPGTPDVLASFAVMPVADRLAPLRLDLRQGSAAALPIADKSVDMAITVLALEQMERIRDAAIAELVRVARRHVVMIEPFADWNADGHRREYIRRHDYFSSRVDDLRRHGLTPLVATADLPNKLSFRAGVVVAEVTGSR